MAFSRAGLNNKLIFFPKKVENISPRTGCRCWHRWHVSVVVTCRKEGMMILEDNDTGAMVYRTFILHYPNDAWYCSYSPPHPARRVVYAEVPATPAVVHYEKQNTPTLKTYIDIYYILYTYTYI